MGPRPLDEVKHSLGVHILSIHTVDGRNPANQLIGSLSHYLPVFLDPGDAKFLPSTVCLKICFPVPEFPFGRKAGLVFMKRYVLHQYLH